MWKRGLKPTVQPRTTSAKKVVMTHSMSTFSSSSEIAADSRNKIPTKTAPAAPWASVQRVQVSSPWAQSEKVTQRLPQQQLQSQPRINQDAKRITQKKTFKKTLPVQSPSQSQFQPHQRRQARPRQSPPSQHSLPTTSNWATASNSNSNNKSSKPTLNQMVATSKRAKEKERNSKVSSKSKTSPNGDSSVGTNTKKKKKKKAAQPPPEAPSLFDFLAKKQTKKMTNAERKKMKQKEKTEKQRAILAAEEAKKKKRHVVLTKSQLDIQQKMVLNVELTEAEKALAKEVTEKRKRKKRKKKPTRLKRILNQERKESFIAAHGGEDPLAMAMMQQQMMQQQLMQQQSSVNPSTKTDVGLIESVDGKNKDDTNHTDNSNDNNNANNNDTTKTEEKKTNNPWGNGGLLSKLGLEPHDNNPLIAQDNIISTKTSSGETKTKNTPTTPTTLTKPTIPAPSTPSTSLTPSIPITPSSKQSKHVKYPRVANKNVVREYVEQNLSKELDLKVTSMLRTLMEYQEKARKLDPTKAKNSRRLLLGLREVRRSVKTKKAKAIIVATNIDESTTQGGLNDKVTEILGFAKENDIPVLYSMTTRKLGKSLRKPKTACVSILSGDGAHAELKESIAIAKRLAASWTDGVRTTLEEDAAIANTNTIENEKKMVVPKVDNETKSKKVKEKNIEKKQKQDKKKKTKKTKKVAGLSALAEESKNRKQLDPSAGEFTPSWVN